MSQGGGIVWLKPGQTVTDYMVDRGLIITGGTNMHGPPRPCRCCDDHEPAGQLGFGVCRVTAAETHQDRGCVLPGNQ